MLNRISKMFAESKDLRTHRIQNSTLMMEVAYISSLVDENKISNNILVPFAQEKKPFIDLIHFNPEFTLLEDPALLGDTLLRGFTLLSIENHIYKIDTSRMIREQAPQTTVETSIEGPQSSLSEDLADSMNLIRNRYLSPELMIEEFTIGSVSKTQLRVVFDARRVDPTILSNLREQLMTIDTDILNAAGQLTKMLTKRKRPLFPTMLITERPDRIASGISEGKLAIIMQGSKFGILLPINFLELMHATEDRYESYWMTRLIIILRCIALFMTIALPALYIAVVSYNPEIFRVQLALSIAGSRSELPYPSFFEVFIMLFMIESLIEASVRLPSHIGSTATTVGGLILGQAAQQAGLVSSIMIIVTSVVAISNFVIPVNSFSRAIRFLKYPLVFLSIFFGLSGVIIGIVFYLIYLCNLRSFGKPFFGFAGRMKDQQGDIGQVNIE